jgi:hypothetical protein
MATALPDRLGNHPRLGLGRQFELAGLRPLRDTLPFNTPVCPQWLVKRGRGRSLDKTAVEVTCGGFLSAPFAQEAKTIMGKGGADLSTLFGDSIQLQHPEPEHPENLGKFREPLTRLLPFFGHWVKLAEHHFRGRVDENLRHLYVGRIQ